jgi:hypothetical protein
MKIECTSHRFENANFSTLNERNCREHQHNVRDFERSCNRGCCAYDILIDCHIENSSVIHWMTGVTMSDACLALAARNTNRPVTTHKRDREEVWRSDTKHIPPSNVRPTNFCNWAFLSFVDKVSHVSEEKETGMQLRTYCCQENSYGTHTQIEIGQHGNNTIMFDSNQVLSFLGNKNRSEEHLFQAQKWIEVEWQINMHTLTDAELTSRTGSSLNWNSIRKPSD